MKFYILIYYYILIFIKNIKCKKFQKNYVNKYNIK